MRSKDSAQFRIGLRNTARQIVKCAKTLWVGIIERGDRGYNANLLTV